MASANRALLCKWLWRFMKEGDRLWVKFLKAIQYMPNRLANFPLKSSVSGPWRDIVCNKTELEVMRVDVNAWVNNHSTFSTKKVRQEIEAKILPSGQRVYQDSKWVPSKVNVFAWRALIDRIPCKAVLHHRGITNNTVCPSCKFYEETPNHMLVNCVLANKV